MSILVGSLVVWDVSMLRGHKDLSTTHCLLGAAVSREPLLARHVRSVAIHGSPVAILVAG